MNRRRNGGFLPPVKQYVNAIERRLHLPLREKARIMSDISTSIAARHEAGESYEAVMADMGPPDAVAAPFNRAFAGQYKGLSLIHISRERGQKYKAFLHVSRQAGTPFTPFGTCCL